MGALTVGVAELPNSPVRMSLAWRAPLGIWGRTGGANWLMTIFGGAITEGVMWTTRISLGTVSLGAWKTGTGAAGSSLARTAGAFISNSFGGGCKDGRGMSSVTW